MREAQLAISSTAVLIKSKSSVCVWMKCALLPRLRIGSAAALQWGQSRHRAGAFHNKPHPCDMAGQMHTLRNKGIHLNLTGVRDEMERL